MNQFQELDKLGSGSYSEVYKVMRNIDKQIYAMKKVKIGMLKDKEKTSALNEIRLLASLNDDYIVSYKEAIYSDDTKTLAIIMEFADGGDIAKMIQERQQSHDKFPEQEIWKAMLQILQGLKTLHDQSILHRDIKSANIFISKGVYKLGDLNVSKIAQRGLVYTQTGTPYYASPEIWRDEPYDNKSDIWSLGCVLYEMCTLHPPFMAQDMEGLYKKIQKGVYPIISGYSGQLQTIISHMLRLNPSSRPSCDQLLSSHLLIEEYAIPYIKHDASLLLNPKLIKTIQLPKNLSNLNDILPQKQYIAQDNKENHCKSISSNKKESNRYCVQSYKLIPIRKSVNQKSEYSQIQYSVDETDQKKLYRIASVHENIPTQPSESKVRSITRRRPSSQYMKDEEELHKKANQIIQRKLLQKQMSEQHPIPKQPLQKQLSNLPYLHKKFDFEQDTKQARLLNLPNPVGNLRRIHRRSNI